MNFQIPSQSPSSSLTTSFGLSLKIAGSPKAFKIGISTRSPVEIRLGLVDVVELVDERALVPCPEDVDDA
jgi:hypothetical protein